jgi:hypothetical protein
METRSVDSLAGYLRTIVDGLEQGDRESAAVAAQSMMRWIETASTGASQAMSEEEIAEAGRLLQRYAALGDKLQHETLEAMNRLGNMRRVAAYASGGRQP